MAISTTCICGELLTLEDELAGQEIQCPRCRRALSVPSLVQRPGRVGLSTMKYVAPTPQDDLTPAQIREIAKRRSKQIALHRNTKWAPTVVIASGGAGFVAAFIVAGIWGVLAWLVILGIVAAIKGCFDYMDKKAAEAELAQEPNFDSDSEA